MKGKARTYKTGCLYGFTYNPLIRQPYWFDLLSVNSIERSTEYLILCFPTKNGFVVGEFIDNQNGELLSDKINGLYLNTFSYGGMFPLRNDFSMAYNFQTTFDRDKIKNFFIIYQFHVICGHIQKTFYNLLRDIKNEGKEEK